MLHESTKTYASYLASTDPIRSLNCINRQVMDRNVVGHVYDLNPAMPASKAEKIHLF